jgi:adenylate kinase
MDVILFGPPGAGKGTQAAAICEALSIPHISTGDIFRKHLKEGTELGELAKSYINQGQLVPDQVVCDIVASRLVEEDCVNGSLLDGFPRTVPQAEMLNEWLQSNSRSVGAVINIEVDPKILVARLSGRRTCVSCGAVFHLDHNPPPPSNRCDRCEGEVVQRKDDSEETVRARLDTYEKDTAPVLSWLKPRALVHTIDGAQPIEDVRGQILAAIKS